MRRKLKHLFHLVGLVLPVLVPLLADSPVLGLDGELLLEPRGEPDLRRPDLRHQRGHVLRWDPVQQPLAPNECVLVHEAVRPGLAQHGELART